MWQEEGPNPENIWESGMLSFKKSAAKILHRHTSEILSLNSGSSAEIPHRSPRNGPSPRPDTCLVFSTSRACMKPLPHKRPVEHDGEIGSDPFRRTPFPDILPHLNFGKKRLNLSFRTEKTWWHSCPKEPFVHVGFMAINQATMAQDLDLHPWWVSSQYDEPVVDAYPIYSSRTIPRCEPWC